MTKILFITGFILMMLACLLWVLGKMPGFQLGKLPGDIFIKKENVTFYFPLTTGLIISVVLSVIMMFIKK